MKLAIDIGGTSIRIALIENNKIIKKEVIDTDGDSMQNNLDQIKEIVDNWNQPFDYIGICCPGPLDLKTGTILITYNLPDWNKKCVLQEFKDLFKIDNVKINNDANVAALGQFTIRKDLHSLLYFTFSTGIGSGFIHQGKIFDGFSGSALEIANALPKYNTENPQRSGIEFLASGKNICLQLEKLGVKVENTKEAFELYKSKENKIVNDFFIKIKEELISLIATSIYFFNPEMIVIGGSVAIKNQEFVTDIFNKVLEVTQDIGYKTKFEFSKDLDDSTLLGCCQM
ncbi:ROK family protein [Spiroplasma diminutum]|uniref:Glucokinase n=1 Tax=Spiroplasma diminutum CUAS-1 TaxID=1276221 RepID=S5MJY0_9MOLU|nr:ROK family protein [Spiroplasma diminutum]AGR42265.1 glucokinase [Spiroplasma diminutum CUAS-1]